MLLKSLGRPLHACFGRFNIGALTIRIGFGAVSYHNYNKEPPKKIV